ncbi:MAG: hypothetical protein ACK5LL_01040, partial [Suipraeoptans sp.]
ISATVNIKADLASELEIDERFLTIEDDGIEEAAANDDGSYTYKITEDLQQDFLDAIKADTDTTIDEYLEHKDRFPAYKSIEYNENMTEFIIDVDPEIFSEVDIELAYVLFINGDFYQSFNSVLPDLVLTTISFVDAGSGDKLATATSDTQY